MGYKEDVLANYNINSKALGDSKTLMAVLEDLLTQKAIAADLRNKQNIFQTRAQAAKETYMKSNPEKNHILVTLEDLEKIAPGIKEHGRQVMSYEQGTTSGTARDCIAKIENELEKVVVVSEK